MQNMHHYWKLLLENYYFLVNWTWIFLYPPSTCVFFMLLLSFFQNLKYTQIYSIYFWFCPYPATTHIMHYYYQELRAGQIIICNFDWKIPFPFNPFQNQPSFIAWILCPFLFDSSISSDVFCGMGSFITMSVQD